MDSIFRIDQQGKVMLAPDAVGLCPEFNLLEQEQVVYLVLAYDCMNTVFKQQPRSEWRKLAAKHVYGTSATAEWADSLIPQPAIDKFKELVRDEEREWKLTLIDKLDEINVKISAETEIKNMNNLVAMRKHVKELLQEAEEKISMTDEKVRLAGKNAQLSYIETWQLRQKKFANL
jgi:hypothetical protein